MRYHLLSLFVIYYYYHYVIRYILSQKGQIVSRYFSEHPSYNLHAHRLTNVLKATSSTTIGTSRDVERHTSYVSTSCRITMKFLFRANHRMRMCVAHRPRVQGAVGERERQRERVSYTSTYDFSLAPHEMRMAVGTARI